MNNATEHIPFFLALKTAIAGIASGFTIAFGWMGWMIIAWIACMVLDYITGSMAAAKNGKWSSATAREGIFHKAGMMVVVIIAAIADAVLATMLANLPNLPLPYQNALLPIVIAWYIFTELGSMAENATAMGAPVPEFLTKLLAAGQGVANNHLKA